MPIAVRRFGVIIVIVIIIVAVFIFRDRLSSNASELQVGDCFDAPTTEGATVSDVQHHPCTEAHTGEVFAVVKDPADSNAVYPDQPARVAFASDQCAAPFLAYVGVAIDQTTLDIRYFAPTADGWGSGDRTFTCYVATDPPATTTIKGAKK